MYKVKDNPTQVCSVVHYISMYRLMICRLIFFLESVSKCVEITGFSSDFHYPHQAGILTIYRKQ